jgi:Synergist-CTERM protein sorting domain-containing protein
LNGTVVPPSATHQAIIWSLQSAGATGASVHNGVLNTTSVGTVTVQAMIVNGLTATAPYMQSFTITVSEVIPSEGRAIELANGTIVNLPGGSVINHDGTMTLSGNGTMTTTRGTRLALPANTVVRPDGTVILPYGVTGTVTTSDGVVSVTVSGGMRVEADGTVTLSGATVTTASNAAIIALSRGRIAEEASMLRVLVGQGGANVTRGGATETVSEDSNIRVNADGGISITHPDDDDSSSSGCNAGFLALALAAIAPFIFRRKK